MGDAFAMASRPGSHDEVEGFGVFVYLEAAAAGLACVAGDLGGRADAVVNDETGLCVDPRDPAAVVEALRVILSSPGLARRFGDNGRQRVLAEFTNSLARVLASDIVALTVERQRDRGPGVADRHDEETSTTT